MGFSLTHLLLLLLIVFIVFGAGKLPRVMGDIGRGVRSLREGLKHEDEAPPKQLSQAADRNVAEKTDQSSKVG